MGCHVEFVAQPNVEGQPGSCSDVILRIKSEGIKTVGNVALPPRGYATVIIESVSERVGDQAKASHLQFPVHAVSPPSTRAGQSNYEPIVQESEFQGMAAPGIEHIIARGENVLSGVAAVTRDRGDAAQQSRNNDIPERFPGNQGVARAIQSWTPRRRIGNHISIVSRGPAE